MGIEVSQTHEFEIHPTRRPHSTAKHCGKLEKVGPKDVLKIGVDGHHSQTLERFTSPT
ncbi:hypothetical protein K443DRAFT_673916 [Laccaria amethystina LaAM-08-1]|uniref:Uncharacterized protein n=1 Tax=Laccaria amethystina LaAM-08-1 TaxID=1095629 RepID=A0A0C9YG91_9AGAR|nr:hypothetical protein K443DRAFT_673916 [Laccaria amethystina LaAM-08-1]